MNATEFDQDYFARLAAARNHWWVQGMQLAALALLGPVPPGARVLDMGCGTGSNLPWAAGLTSARPLHALDLAPAAAAVAAGSLPQGQVSALAGSAAALPYKDACFDLVLSFDVLQHLTSALAAETLREVRPVLVPGGRALLRTNAAFGRSHVPQRADWRLYDARTLRQSLEQADLVVERLTSANMLQSLWASGPALLPRRARAHPDAQQQDPPTPPQHRQTTADTGHHGLGIPAPVGPLRNGVLRRVLAAEAALLRRSTHSLPFGHSLLALVRRPVGDQA